MSYEDNWNGAEQDENLGRVTARIGAAILEFFAERTKARQLSYHADDLRRHVRARVGEVAPGSPDRVMRLLRKEKLLSYKVVSRKESLYRITQTGVQVELDC